MVVCGGGDELVCGGKTQSGEKRNERKILNDTVQQGQTGVGLICPNLD